MEIPATGLPRAPSQAANAVTFISMDALKAAGERTPGDAARVTDMLKGLGATTAKVLEARPGNVHVLDFNGTQVTLKLARPFPPGEVLTVLFAGTTDAEGAQPDVALSPSARFISAALSGPAGSTAPATSAAPLASGRQIDATALAGALQNAVGNTGIFYESHLAGWVAGQFSSDEIRKEPKARIAATEPQGVDASGEEAPSPSLVGLVHRQLDALENRAVEWRGAVWQGQQGDIRIAEERPADDSNEPVKSWSTRLQLDLPRLGKIDARLSLQGQRLRVSLDAAPAAGPSLDAARKELAAALAARGFDTERLEIRAHG